MNKHNNLDPEISSLLGIDTIKKEQKKEQKKNTHNEKNNQENEPNSINSLFKTENKELLNKLIQAKLLFDDKNNKHDRSTLKAKLQSAYQELYSELATKLNSHNLTPQQLLCLRFNLLDPKYISEKQQNLLNNINNITEKQQNHSFFYIDEWLKNIGAGKIEKSLTDETIKIKKQSQEAITEKLKKKQGQEQAEISLIKAKINEIQQEEEKLKNLTKETIHIKKNLNVSKELKNIELIETYSHEQKQSIVEMLESCRKLIRKDKELNIIYNTFYKLEEDISILTDKDKTQNTKTTHTIKQELETLRQMIKMTVGKQGNHFPILLKQYFSENINEIASKENIDKIVKTIENIDSKIFNRVYKGVTNKVTPYFIILPCYGDNAICWEPIPRHNRATGKGTIAIPLFPKKLDHAIFYGLGDLRWQIAKEKAAYRWMEEGLTGQYYLYYEKEKLKGNVKDIFIEDYITWIKYESQGKLKLHKDVRAIFWRLIPFTEQLKEELSNKGYIYSELFVKDKLREQSRGY